MECYFLVTLKVQDQTKPTNIITNREKTNKKNHQREMSNNKREEKQLKKSYRETNRERQRMSFQREIPNQMKQKRSIHRGVTK